MAPQSLAHHFQYTGRRDRIDALIEYIKKEKISQAIIFCNSRHHGEKLIRELEGKFKSIMYIHGGLEQSRRTSIFERFRRDEINFMVATDVAGRGLDFSHVSHVINYDYPYGLEAYTHRTGRTGRMGRLGIAMTFVTDQELKDVKSLLQDEPHRSRVAWRYPTTSRRFPRRVRNREATETSRNGHAPPSNVAPGPSVQTTPQGGERMERRSPPEKGR